MNKILILSIALLSMMVFTVSLSCIVSGVATAESTEIKVSSIDTLEFEISFDKLPKSYELLMQYRKKGEKDEKDWKDYGPKRYVENWPSYLKEENKLKFRTIPFLFIKEHGTYEFRVIGAVKSLNSKNPELTSAIKEITIGKPKGCGTKCTEEPALPPGTDVITYCSKPLTVPNDELSDSYKEYPNVKKNKEREDNRYFVYVSKGSSISTLVEVKNLNEIKIEPLMEGVSFNGKELTIDSNTAFIIHGNADKKTPLVDSCAFRCDEKPLELKGKDKKSKLYPTEDCGTFTATMVNGLLESQGTEGIKPGILYAALFGVIQDIKTTIAHAIVNAKLGTLLPTDETVFLTLEIVFGGEPIPLIEGQSYFKDTIYTTKGEVQRAFEYARTLRDLETTERMKAIDRWISENGVYASDRVTDQLGVNYRTDTGEINKLKNPDLAEFGKKFLTSELGEQETLTNIMGNKLADGRFMCVCRDISLLGAAMAREARVDASLATGLSPTGKGEGNLGRHAWVRFKDSQGRLVDWDPTASLAEDIFEQPRSNFINSVDHPNKFSGRYRLLMPDIRSSNTIFSSVTDKANNEISIFSAKGPESPVVISNIANDLGIGTFIDYPNTDTLIYKLNFDLSDSSKIPVIDLHYEREPFMDSFKVTASTKSKIPIILDRDTELIPINPDKFPKKVLASIYTFNEGYQSFLQAPPATAPALVEEQGKSLGELKNTIKELDVQPTPEDTVRLKNSMGNVRSIVTKMQSEETVTNALYDSLGKAKNSPLKGKLVSIQNLKSNPRLAESIGISSTFLSTGTNIALTFSPLLQDYANDIDNANLILAAKSINVAGIGVLPVAVGTFVREVVSVGLASGASAAVGIARGLAASSAVGYAVGAVASSVGTTFYCAFNQDSNLCGCHVTDDYGGKPLLELQKYTVRKGDTIKYRVMGFENCPTPAGLQSLSGIVNLASLRAPDMKLKAGKHDLKGSCEWQENGKWCLGEVAVNLNPGDYELTVVQPYVVVGTEYTSPIKFYEHKTNQKLTVLQ